MIADMTSGLKIAIASYGPAQFEFLRENLVDLGHIPVAYVKTRSMRPSEPPDSGEVEAIQPILADLPLGMDFLLPGTPGAVAAMLTGYRPDLLLVLGFNWRLPREVLELPRLGVLNVHPSALPKYRGPSAIPHIVRNGDPSMGITIHRMTERIDAGPILAQTTDVPVPEEATFQNVWERAIRPALPDLLAEALEAAARGEPGRPQDDREATYAGFPPQDWYEVTWQGARRDIHNQIRVLRFLRGGQGPVVPFQGETVQVHRTSLTADGGVRIECADGPLWVTCTPTN